MTTRGRCVGLTILVAVLAGCGSVAQAPAASPAASSRPTLQPSTQPAPQASSAPAPADTSLAILITTSTYGEIAAEAQADAKCEAKVSLPSGSALSLPEQIAAADGSVDWVYPKPSGQKGQGTHTITCSLFGGRVAGSATRTFEAP